MIKIQFEYGCGAYNTYMVIHILKVKDVDLE